MTPEVNCSSLLASGSFPRVACHLEGGFPGGSKVKNPLAKAGKVGSIPRSKRKGQSTSVFLPAKSHGERSLAYYSPMGLQLNTNNNSTVARVS